MQKFHLNKSSKTIIDKLNNLKKNDLIKDIQQLDSGSTTKELATKLCHHVFDLAKMSKQHLSGEDMQSFIQRSNELMSELSAQKRS